LADNRHLNEAASQKLRRRASSDGAGVILADGIRVREPAQFDALALRRVVAALGERALAFDVIDVRRIEGMLKDARRTEDAAVATGRLIPMPARFAGDAATARRQERIPLGTPTLLCPGMFRSFSMGLSVHDPVARERCRVAWYHVKDRSPDSARAVARAPRRV
jgi:hypothetical protein